MGRGCFPVFGVVHNKAGCVLLFDMELPDEARGDFHLYDLRRSDEDNIILAGLTPTPAQ